MKSMGTCILPAGDFLRHNERSWAKIQPKMESIWLKRFHSLDYKTHIYINKCFAVWGLHLDAWNLCNRSHVPWGAKNRDSMPYANCM